MGFSSMNLSCHLQKPCNLVVFTAPLHILILPCMKGHFLGLLWISSYFQQSSCSFSIWKWKWQLDHDLNGNSCFINPSPAEGQLLGGHHQKKTHATCATFLDSLCFHLLWPLLEKGCWARRIFGPNRYSSNLILLAEQVREGLQKITFLLSSSCALTSNSWAVLSRSVGPFKPV